MNPITTELSRLPRQKTKIVATIGPASESPDVLKELLHAGMNVARLNFSHGDFIEHGQRIERIRNAERETGCRVAIMADLPGPKIRVGPVEPDPIQLRVGAPIALTNQAITGNAHRVGVSFFELPQVVKAGDRLFLNDGLIQLKVERVEGTEVICVVLAGGELRSRKGLNLPGIRLGASSFTARDRDCLEFALREGVDAVSQSFVDSAVDIELLRSASAAFGRVPFIVAKIERAGALANIDEILRAADGLMVARGDLGVELPIERIPLAQKMLVAKANLAGKPVITATQMLESMVASPLPTRAEATDVTNAILDGSDAVMLSAESAVGRYPVEAVTMLAKIAAATEPERAAAHLERLRQVCRISPGKATAEAVAAVVERALESVPCAAVIVPTRSGSTARFISRCRPFIWILAVCRDRAVAQGLVFSYGVEPMEVADDSTDWRGYARQWLSERGQTAEMALLVTGPSERNPDANHRIEFMRL